MNPTDDRLDSLANSVVDDRAVDWDGAETDSQDSPDHASVKALREVAKIAQFNRGLQRSPVPLRPPGSQESMEGAAEPQRWGDLVLLERVGTGATGEVWRAWDPKLQREVALKFLVSRGAGSPPGDPSLLEEARALARVRHPGVVAVHDIEEHQGRVGLTLEFLKGRTLDDEIERRGPLPAAEVARIGVKLSLALEAVHAAGLLHRDIKPANVVIEPDGRVVLADFGLGQRRGVSETGMERISGTPMFMSPERLLGDPSTPRSDLYSLGVTLRYALTGKLPFAARSLEELKAEVGAGATSPVSAERPGTPATLAAAIDRAMAPTVEKRFISAQEMSVALKLNPHAMGSAPGQPRTMVPPALAAGIAILAAAAAAWYGPRIFGHRESPRTAVTPAATEAATAAPYEVEATLVRRSGGTFQRLAAGHRIAPGDQLSLEFRASRPAWVYVLNEDERGESYLLFPQPRFDRSNPIPANTSALLPGTIGGKENGWTVTSRGGREHFLVVSSPQPVPEIEADLSRLPAAQPGRPVQYAAIGRETMQRLRGVGGVSPLPAPRASSRSGLFDRFESLSGRETGVKGVWVRKITLENPDR